MNWPGWDVASSTFRIPALAKLPPPQPTLGRSKLQNEANEACDEVVAGWPRDQLVRMDARFCERLERAIATGTEKAQQRPPRW